MKIKALHGILALVLVALIVGCNTAPDAGKVVLKDRKDSISYIIGLDYGAGLKNRFVDYNPDAVYKGIVDFQMEKDLFSDSIKVLLLNEVNAEINQNLLDDFNAKLAEMKKVGTEFLDQNKTGEGIVELPTGMQYKIIASGATNRTPGATDSVLVHYQTKFIDGTIVEETYGNPPTGFRISSLNPGLAEGIQLMNPGAIYEFYIPSSLSFGDKHFVNEEGQIIVPAGSTLIYKVELINIVN